MNGSNISIECSKVNKNCRGYATPEEEAKYTGFNGARGRSSLSDYSIGKAKECCGDLNCRKFPGFYTNCKICKRFKKDCSHACFVYVCVKH